MLPASGCALCEQNRRILDDPGINAAEIPFERADAPLRRECYLGKELLVRLEHGEETLPAGGFLSLPTPASGRATGADAPPGCKKPCFRKGSGIFPRAARPGTRFATDVFSPPATRAAGSVRRQLYPPFRSETSGGRNDPGCSWIRFRLITKRRLLP